jgi:hypothetical protein
MEKPVTKAVNAAQNLAMNSQLAQDAVAYFNKPEATAAAQQHHNRSNYYARYAMSQPVEPGTPKHNPLMVGVAPNSVPAPTPATAGVAVAAAAAATTRPLVLPPEPEPPKRRVRTPTPVAAPAATQTPAPSPTSELDEKKNMTL